MLFSIETMEHYILSNKASSHLIINEYNYLHHVKYFEYILLAAFGETLQTGMESEEHLYPRGFDFSM